MQRNFEILRVSSTEQTRAEIGSQGQGWRARLRRAELRSAARHRLALRVTLKPADDKRIYGFSFPDPVAEADVVEATDTAEDGLRSG